MTIATRNMRKAVLTGLLAPLFGLFAINPAHAQSQAWPNKTVRIIVPFAAGTTDVLSRVYAKSVSGATGQPFVVENKLGASGTIGAAEVARAAPDGYTLLVTTPSTHAIGLHLNNPPYDTAKDFTPIAHLGDTELVLLASPKSGFRTMQEFIAAARSKPGSLSYASNGVGTIGHLTLELLSAQAGISLTHVPYKGSGLAIPDVATGRVALGTDVPGTGIGHIKGGTVIGIAVTGPNRAALLPDVPTVAEAVPGFSVLSWFGLYGPAGMPSDLTQRIHGAFARAMSAPEIAEQHKTLGVNPGRGSPADFAAMAAKDSAQWGRLIKDRNIRAE